jgi:protein phosphatase 1 regulatory subunit 11
MFTAQPAATTGSTTTLEQTASIPITQTHGTLVLRAEPAEQRRIQWAQDVVDNEGMGKKSSKGMFLFLIPFATRPHLF